MRVLVTGAHGFIGINLVKSLAGSGLHIRLLVRDELKIDPPIPDGMVDIWKGDLTVPSSLSGITNGVDTVYHLAGEVRNPSAYDPVNRLGTRNLLDQCRSGGVRRFVHVSSVGVMGAGTMKAVVDETTQPVPRNAYEVSKYAGEQLALEYDDPHGMRVCVLRPSIVYGEGRKRGRDSFLSLLRAIKKRRFVLLGPHFISSFIYIGDVAAACLALANYSRAGGETYIINEPIPLRQFIECIYEELNLAPPIVLPGYISHPITGLLRMTGKWASLYNRTFYSMDKLTRTGFSLPYTYTSGLRQTIRWYLRKGLL